MSNFGQELKDGVGKIKRGLIVADVVVLLLGLLMVVFPTVSAEIICRILGIVLLALGAWRLIEYFRGDRMPVFGSFGLVRGAALVGFGLYFLIRPDHLASVLTVGMGIALLVGCVMKLQYGVDLMRMKLSLWWVELIGAAVMAVLGIIALANPFKAASGLMIFIGISFMFNALWDLTSVLYVSTMGKKVKNSMNKMTF